MSDDQRKTQKIIEAASRAVEKITDPVKRKAAEAKLTKMRKTADRSAATARSAARDRDFDR